MLLLVTLLGGFLIVEDSNGGNKYEMLAHVVKHGQPN